MKSVIITSPGRTNWKLFCQEPSLTKQEQTLWRQMGQLHLQDNAFASYCDIETVKEWAAAKAINSQPSTKDWSDLVQWADAYRVLKRAEIEAYRKWTVQRRRDWNETLQINR